MKKFVSLALALTLVCALAAPAAAVTVTEYIPFQYDYVGAFLESHFREGLEPVRRDGQWGYIDRTGKLVLSVPYDSVNAFHEGLAVVYYNEDNGNGGYNYSYGYIDKTGKEVIPLQYRDASGFSEGLAPVQGDSGRKDERGKPIYMYGYIDKTGKVVTPFQYEGAYPFDEGLAAVEGDTGRKDRFGKPVKLWGYVDKTGKLAIPLQYVAAFSFNEGLAAVKGDSGEKDESGDTIYKWGFIDKTGKVVVPFRYDYVESFSGGRAEVNIGGYPGRLVYGRLEGGLWGYVDKTGREVVPCRYQEIEWLEDDLGRVKRYNKYGLIDREGKELVPCQYKFLYEFGETFPGLALVCGEDTSRYGLLDKSGREVLPCEYSWTDEGEELRGLRPVKDKNDLVGFLDATGKLVVPCQYERVMKLSEGMARVRVGGQWGYIDQTGQVVIPCQYDDATDFSEGFARVKADGKWSYIDQTGKELSSLSDKGGDTVGVLSDGMVRVMETRMPYAPNLYGYMDQTGRQVIPCKYASAEDFSEGLAVVYTQDPMVTSAWTNEWGFIDKTGRMVLRLNQYFHAEAFSEGLAAVCNGSPINGKWGYIDKTGKEVIPCQYASASDFENGVAEVSVENDAGSGWKYGLIDRTGKEFVPCQYDEVKELSPGLWQLKENGKLGYADRTGVFTPCQYDSVEDFSEGLGGVKLAKNEGRMGFLSADYRVIQPCKYVFIREFGEVADGLAEVCVDGKLLDKDGYEVPLGDEKANAVWHGSGKWGLIDRYGREVLPCVYDEIEDFNDGIGQAQRDGKWGILALGPSIAYPSTQKVEVDGKAVEFQCYALKEGNGMTNYIKLRDLADILDGSAAQFQVGWNGKVTITSGESYTKNGSEQNTPFSGQREYKDVTAKTMVDGKAKALAAFTLTDDTGGGYTYYKLRDLGTALGFTVDWSKERGIFIETE